MVCIENGHEHDIELSELFAAGGDKKYTCLLTLDEFKNTGIDAGLKQKMTEEFHNHNNINSKIEKHDSFDLIYLSIPKQLARKDNADSLSVFISRNLLLIVYLPWEEYRGFDRVIIDGLCKNASLGANLLFLLDTVTREDSHALQSIEEKITDLEDDLITSYNNEYIKDIICLRKSLLYLKRYYEQMVDLFDELDENESSFLTAPELKRCGNIAGRIDRLYHTVLNMRDYVTQVREAYQSQEDLNLNTIMKVFTVITTIFLPLTLITGWYGMNLQMPEYGWNHGYPIVVSISVLVVALCIMFFKKNKWF